MASKKITELLQNTNVNDDDLFVIETANGTRSVQYSKIKEPIGEDIEEDISKHNISNYAHNDIRNLVSSLINRMNALADSDDTTLDQLSEIVAYIKSNRDLIDGVTTGKVNVSDIVDNLTSEDADKPLSAHQGKVLKELITTLESTVSMDTTAADAYNQANSAYNQANAVSNTVTNAYTQANNAYNKANSASNTANSAYTQANSAYTKANEAYNLASASGDIEFPYGYNVCTAYKSISIGFSAYASLESVAIGSSCGSNEITGGVFIGSNTLASSVNSNYCVCIGYNARNQSRAESSVVIGHDALIGPVAFNSVAIGPKTKVQSANCSTAIGYNAYVNSANTIQLGDATSLSKLSCKVTLTTASDERDKADITSIEDGAVEFLKKVKAIRYVFNSRDLYSYDDSELTEEELEKRHKFGLYGYDKEAHAAGTKKGSRIRVGVSAQETQRALKEVYNDSSYGNIVDDNLFDFDPDEIPDDIESQLSVNYTGFIPFLIKAIQEIDERLTALENK